MRDTAPARRRGAGGDTVRVYPVSHDSGEYGGIPGGRFGGRAEVEDVVGGEEPGYRYLTDAEWEEIFQANRELKAQLALNKAAAPAAPTGSGGSGGSDRSPTVRKKKVSHDSGEYGGIPGGRFGGRAEATPPAVVTQAPKTQNNTVRMSPFVKETFEMFDAREWPEEVHDAKRSVMMHLGDLVVADGLARMMRLEMKKAADGKGAPKAAVQKAAATAATLAHARETGDAGLVKTASKKLEKQKRSLSAAEKAVVDRLVEDVVGDVQQQAQKMTTQALARSIAEEMADGAVDRSEKKKAMNARLAATFAQAGEREQARKAKKANREFARGIAEELADGAVDRSELQMLEEMNARLLAQEAELQKPIIPRRVTRSASKAAAAGAPPQASRTADTTTSTSGKKGKGQGKGKSAAAPTGGVYPPASRTRSGTQAPPTVAANSLEAVLQGTSSSKAASASGKKTKQQAELERLGATAPVSTEKTTRSGRVHQNRVFFPKLLR